MFGEQYGTILVPLTMSSARIEIDQYTPDWTLSQTDGDAAAPRIFRQHVAFDIPFANIPMVHVGISGFDIDNRDTSRLSVRPEAISASGFDLLVQTWLNTRVYKVEISWIALGHQSTS